MQQSKVPVFKISITGLLVDNTWEVWNAYVAQSCQPTSRWIPDHSRYCIVGVEMSPGRQTLHVTIWCCPFDNVQSASDQILHTPSPKSRTGCCGWMKFGHKVHWERSLICMIITGSRGQGQGVHCTHLGCAYLGQCVHILDVHARNFKCPYIMEQLAIDKSVTSYFMHLRTNPPISQSQHRLTSSQGVSTHSSLWHSRVCKGCVQGL